MALGPSVWDFASARFLSTTAGTGATALGGKMVRTRNGAAARVWSRVDVRGPDECWPWIGSRLRDGRGRFHWMGRSMTAPRIIWAIVNGLVPPPHLFVCHACDNPPCCNPAHLWLGTNSQNLRDASAKQQLGGQNRTHCPAGHPYSGSNLIIKRSPQNHFRRFCRACDVLHKQKYKANRPRPRVSSAARTPTDGAG